MAEIEVSLFMVIIGERKEGFSLPIPPKTPLYSIACIDKIYNIITFAHGPVSPIFNFRLSLSLFA